MEWQPIETAPQDRTHVLLFAKTRWNKRIPALPFAGYGADGFWYCLNGDEAVQQIKPTHWMPLPAPPTQGENR